MKKVVALLLALCLLMSVTAAFAETRQYMMTAVVDAEGNIVVSDEFPVLVLVIDDETMECAFGTEEDAVTGTFDYETVEDVVYLVVNLEDGSELYMVYADDTFMLLDEANNLTYVLMNIETLEAEAA